MWTADGKPFSEVRDRCIGAKNMAFALRNFLIGGCVTVPTQPSKLGSLKKTVGDFRLPLRFTDFGTQGGAKMGGVLVEMG